MQRELFMFVILLSLVVATKYGRTWYVSTKLAEKKHYDTPITFLENCQFPTKWDMTYRAVCLRPNRKVSKPVCEDRVEQRPQWSDLEKQFQLVCAAEDVDVLVGMDFDVPYRIMYHCRLKLLMINPKVVKNSKETKTCNYQLEDGTIVRKPGQYHWLDVAYSEIKGIQREHHFGDLDSCSVQLGFDSLNNKC
jgi:hypothetical protein